MIEHTATEILATQLGPNAGYAKTIRRYLVNLLMELCEEGEEFDARQPFGQLGWKFELRDGLVAAGLATQDDEERIDMLIRTAVASFAYLEDGTCAH